MNGFRQIITAVTDAYEQARPDLGGECPRVHRAVAALVADLSLFEWREAHASEGTDD